MLNGKLAQMGVLNNWIANCLCIDSSHPIYQTCCSCTTAELEIGSLAIGGYGLAKEGLALAKMARCSLSRGVKTVGKVVVQEVKSIGREGLLRIVDARIA